jgi:hypothetical protein
MRKRPSLRRLIHGESLPEGTNDTVRWEVMNDLYKEPVYDNGRQMLLAYPSLSMSVRLLQER